MINNVVDGFLPRPIVHAVPRISSQRADVGIKRRPSSGVSEICKPGTVAGPLHQRIDIRTVLKYRLMDCHDAGCLKGLLAGIDQFMLTQCAADRMSSLLVS